MSTYIIYTDGASRGNPGPASYGIFITSENNQKVELKGVLGTQTNNFAEYSAVIEALKWVSNQKIKSAEIRSDSEFLVKQLNGLYKVKSEVIKPLFLEVKKIISEHKLEIKFTHVRREFNKEADRLANEALDGY